MKPGKPLTRTPLNPGKGLQRRGELKPRTDAPRKPRRGISPASVAQRAKVRHGICRECGASGVHPAHAIDRSLGGCDDALCVLELCPFHHREYDEHRLDVLPHLSLAEQAHAVSHLGLVGALNRLTGDRYVPEREAA